MLFGQLISLLLIVAQPADARVQRIPPLDQCGADPSFTACRAELEQAGARKDGDFLVGVDAEGIEVDFGGRSGRAGFAETWKLAGACQRSSPATDARPGPRCTLPGLRP